MILDVCSKQGGHESKQNRGKNNKQSVLKTKIICFVTCITRTVINQERIIAAGTQSNSKRHSQTFYASFLQQAISDEFCCRADNKENCLVALDGFFVPHKDADFSKAALLETIVHPVLLKECVPINLKSKPVKLKDN